MNTQIENNLTQVSAFKRQVFYATEDIRSGNNLAKFFGALIFVLIVANALLVVSETQQGLPDAVYAGMLLFGSLSTACFGLEYGARLWIADLVYPSLSPARARLRYVLSPMGIIDFLAFAPGVVAWVIPVSAQALSGLRIIRLVRLIKISRYMRGLRSISNVFHERRNEIISAFMVLALLTITSSVLMFQIENPAQPDKFDSVFTGMYWAMTTITTTGYGDLAPITGLGRFVGFCTMVLSIAVIAIPAGIFSAGFVAEFRAEAVMRDGRQDAEQNTERDTQDKDA